MSKIAGVKRKLEGVSISKDGKVMPNADTASDSTKVRPATEKDLAHYFSPKPKQSAALPLNAARGSSDVKVQRNPSPSRTASSSVPRSTHASVSKPASTSASTMHSTVQRSSLASTSSAASSTKAKVGVASRVVAPAKAKAGVASAGGATAVGSASSDKSGGFWKQKLLAAMNDDSLKVFEDERVVVIRDAYPKARFHFLCLPKRSINTLSELGREDVELLRWMRRCAEQVCVQHAGLPPSSDDHSSTGASTSESTIRSKFRFGYHAIPSMNRLHLHAISTDFNSPCLKTRKHWNSFNTPYFLDAQAVESELEQSGTVQVDRAKCAKWMDEALRCHVCKREFATLPALKLHIASHL